MATSNHQYILIGDENAFNKFKIEGVGQNVIIENKIDNRYYFMLDENDWKVMKEFIDKQFEKK